MSNRCLCGQFTLPSMANANTGSVVDRSMITVSDGLTWKLHSSIRCDGYYSTATANEGSNV